MEIGKPALAQEPGVRHHALIVNSSPEINQLLGNLFEEPEWNLQFVNDGNEVLLVKHLDKVAPTHN